MKSTVLFLLILFFISCTDNYKLKYESSEKELITLRAENERLMKDLKTLEADVEGYRNTPQKLFANAFNLYSKKKIFELMEIKSNLNKYHPESNEAIRVNEMCNKLNAEIKKQKEDSIKHEIAKKEAAIKKRMQAVNKLRKKYDDVSGTTWYYNPYFTHYTNSNLTSLYIGKNGNSVWLRLKMSYNGDDWIFFENAYLSYDGNTQEINFDKYKDKETDNDTEVWEWIDISVDKDLLAFIKEMIKGKSFKMRLSGKYSKTRNLTSKEVNGLKDVLLAYDVLQNEQ